MGLFEYTQQYAIFHARSYFDDIYLKKINRDELVKIYSDGGELWLKVVQLIG